MSLCTQLNSTVLIDTTCCIQIVMCFILRFCCNDLQLCIQLNTTSTVSTHTLTFDNKQIIQLQSLLTSSWCIGDIASTNDWWALSGDARSNDKKVGEKVEGIGGREGREDEERWGGEERERRGRERRGRGEEEERERIRRGQKRNRGLERREVSNIKNTKQTCTVHVYGYFNKCTSVRTQPNMKGITLFSQQVNRNLRNYSERREIL